MTTSDVLCMTRNKKIAIDSGITMAASIPARALAYVPHIFGLSTIKPKTSNQSIIKGCTAFLAAQPLYLFCVAQRQLVKPHDSLTEKIIKTGALGTISAPFTTYLKNLYLELTDDTRSKQTLKNAVKNVKMTYGFSRSFFSMPFVVRNIVFFEGLMIGQQSLTNHYENLGLFGEKLSKNNSMIVNSLLGASTTALFCAPLMSYIDYHHTEKDLDRKRLSSHPAKKIGSYVESLTIGKVGLRGIALTIEFWVFDQLYKNLSKYYSTSPIKDS